MPRNITLRGADGSMWDLLDGPVRAGLNPQLWGSGAVQISERTSSVLPGTRVTHRRHVANDLIIPIVVLDPTVFDVEPWPSAGLIDAEDVVVVDDDGFALLDGGTVPPHVGTSIEDTVAAFARALDSVRGDLIITVERPDDTARQIVATYLDGWSMLSMRDKLYPNALQTTIACRATDPYWTSVADESIIVEPPAPVFTEGTSLFSSSDVNFSEGSPFNGFIVDDTLFDDPDVLFNGVVGFSGLGAGVRLFDLSNTGDVLAWPTFTVAGPATVVEVDNVTTGARWRLDDLTETEVLTISTKPGESRVRVGTTNAFGRLLEGSTLWSMALGENVIAVRVDGGTEASAFAMHWRPRYLTC